MLSDSHTVNAIRKFLASEKPTHLQPVDLLFIIHLMVQKAEDHPIFDSHQTLAKRFNVAPKTVKKAQDRLKADEVGWISCPQRRGMTNALSLNYERIPGDDILPTKVTNEAKTLAHRYKTALIKWRVRRKFPKAWLGQQFLSAQRILDAVSGDMEIATALVSHALNHPNHRKAAAKSLYNLFGRWDKILTTYSDVLQAQHEERVQAREAQWAAHPHASSQAAEVMQ